MIKTEPAIQSIHPISKTTPFTFHPHFAENFWGIKIRSRCKDAASQDISIILLLNVACLACRFYPYPSISIATV